MGFFDFFKKKETGGVVWRNLRGEITCPGDSCPKDCDNTCPIYLNTQAAMLMSVGQLDKALSMYKETLEVAPDFYDAWNNLGSIYGQQGDYQVAYEHYSKAHELYPHKSSPVFGLMMTTRDLKKYEECLQWCDLYKSLSSDGKDIPVRKAVNEALGTVADINKTNRF